jgi:cullin-5
MLFSRSSKLVKDAFSNDPRFLTARDKAFKTVVNDTSVFKLELPTTKQVNILFTLNRDNLH